MRGGDGGGERGEVEPDRVGDEWGRLVMARQVMAKGDVPILERIQIVEDIGQYEIKQGPQLRQVILHPHANQPYILSSREKKK